MNKKKRLLTTLAVGTAAFAMLGIGNTVAKIEDSALSAAAETVAVTVTVGEEVTPYADLQSALDYANTQDSAKITLVADTVEGVSQWVYTNLTLDLAGKEINNISLSMSSQASNASLVIEDSSGNNAGRLTPISGVTFSAMYSGQVTINGGTFIAGEGIWALNENDATGGAIVVYGGTFVGFNPANNVSEGEGTNFLASGYAALENNGAYTVEKSHTHTEVEIDKVKSLFEALI